MATISVPNPMWEMNTIKSKAANVVASAGTIEAVAGHILYEQADGSYKAFPVATDLSSTEGKVCILGEDATLTTTAKSLRVIFMGTVFIQAIRDAGIVAAKLSDKAIMDMSTDRTAIDFVDYKNEEVYHG